MYLMDEFIDKVKEALELCDYKITPDTNFRDLPNWSSMNALIILAMFETEFDITITGDNLRSSNTIKDLYGFLPA